MFDMKNKLFIKKDDFFSFFFNFKVLNQGYPIYNIIYCLM